VHHQLPAAARPPARHLTSLLQIANDRPRLLQGVASSGRFKPASGIRECLVPIPTSGKNGSISVIP